MMMRISLVAFTMLAGLPIAAQEITGTDDVEVLVFNRISQALEPCEQVTKFYSAHASQQDLATSFSRCVGHQIPRGFYKLRVVSKSFAPKRDYDCAAIGWKPVCIIVPDRGDWFAEDTLEIKIDGVLKPEGVYLLFRSVFDTSQPWSRTVGVDARMHASIETAWLDLVVTVIADGSVIGSTTIDRRLSRHHFSISVDRTRKQVTAKPGISGGTVAQW